MKFEPRDSLEIQRSMSARFVARSDVTDVVEGSTPRHLFASVGDEIALVEHRLRKIRDSFSLDDVFGPDLDERIAELPKGPDGRRFEPRMGKAAASGSVLSLTRDDTTEELILDEGGLVGSSGGNVQYRVGAVSFPVGVATVQNVAVTCTKPGSVGNCASGVIQRILDLPDSIIAVVNTLDLSNGMDRETDEQLKTRAYAWLASLAKCQPIALTYLARSFTDSLGRRARTASLYEDPWYPAYSELLVDDGTGMEGSDRLGVTTSGTVPEGGQTVVWHEGPATLPIDVVRVTRGASTFLLKASDGQILPLPERGLVYIRPGLLEEGDEWEIGEQTNGEQYRVYTGLVAELQYEIEGDPSQPATKPGWRAGATRCRVKPPVVQWLGFDLHLIPKAGKTLADVVDRARADAVAFLQTLPPGATFFVPRMVTQLLKNTDLQSVRVYQKGLYVELEDVAARKPFYAIRSRTDLIGYVSAPEE